MLVVQNSQHPVLTLCPFSGNFFRIVEIFYFFFFFFFLLCFAIFDLVYDVEAMHDIC